MVLKNKKIYFVIIFLFKSKWYNIKSKRFDMYFFFFLNEVNSIVKYEEICCNGVLFAK